MASVLGLQVAAVLAVAFEATTAMLIWRWRPTVRRMRTEYERLRNALEGDATETGVNLSNETRLSEVLRTVYRSGAIYNDVAESIRGMWFTTGVFAIAAAFSVINLMHPQIVGPGGETGVVLGPLEEALPYIVLGIGIMVLLVCVGVFLYATLLERKGLDPLVMPVLFSAEGKGTPEAPAKLAVVWTKNREGYWPWKVGIGAVWTALGLTFFIGKVLFPLRFEDYRGLAATWYITGIVCMAIGLVLAYLGLRDRTRLETDDR